MTATSRIFPGIRLYGNHGPLIDNPNGLGKRRVRSNVFGTVIKAGEQYEWEVLFEFNSQTKTVKSKTVKSKSLKGVQSESGIPLNE